MDLKGKIVGCPRYRFKPVQARELHLVYPKFHDQAIEPDYYYERRMSRYLELLNTRGVIYAAIFRYIGVEPTIEGHWRLLCEQNVSYQSRKFMSTKNENSALFYVSVGPFASPRNLRRSAEELEKITHAISPTKRFIYRATFRDVETPAERLVITDEKIRERLTARDRTLVEERTTGATRKTIRDLTQVSDVAYTGSICDIRNLG